MRTHKVTITRIDSETAIVFENVKHVWTEGNHRFVLAIYSSPPDPKHYYVIYPWNIISHIKIEKDY